MLADQNITYNALFHSTQDHGLDSKSRQISMLGKLVAQCVKELLPR
jgi:hypothetical protein